MTDRFFMIYGNGQSAPTVKHHNIEAATREAERLSRSNPGIEFFVMMPVSVSKRVDVSTTKLVDLEDLVPF
jgi:hypothetical protein